MRMRLAVFAACWVPLACYDGVEDDAADELGDASDSTDPGSSGSDSDSSSGDGDGDGDGDPTSTTSDPSTTDSTTTDPSTTDPSTTDSTTSDPSETDSTTGGVEGCSADALALIDLVNAYRADNDLPAIPASPSLCTVATSHVHDLVDNAPHTQPGGCNLHSWSDQGPWSACCYTPDHAQAQCMWDKPSELTVYPGYGYENAASGVGSPAQALQLWQSSQPHNEVILNLGIWADHPWGALGADVYQGFAVLWFGEQADPAP